MTNSNRIPNSLVDSVQSEEFRISVETDITSILTQWEEDNFINIPVKARMALCTKLRAMYVSGISNVARHIEAAATPRRKML